MLRYVCVASKARERSLDLSISIYLSGCVTNRSSLYNPCLVTPESSGLLTPGLKPSANARRNLTLITKLLQVGTACCCCCSLLLPHAYRVVLTRCCICCTR